MTEESNLKEFPDLSNKLAAPTKKSLFERQKAEAEAKRLREEAETAAVYEDFVKSFEDEGPDTRQGFGSRIGSGGNEGLGPRQASGPPKRHFVSSGSRGNSGPGSLGPPPSSLSRKRAFDGSRRDERDRDSERDRDRGIFAYDESSSGPVDAATAFKTSDDEDERAADAKAAERAVPKPTLQLSSLPPGTSPAVIKSLLPANLTVDGVRVVSSQGPVQSGSTERKSMSAIVTLAKDTPASDIDVAVNVLQNRYLGWGYYLSLSRHLSSAALNSVTSNITGIGSTVSSLPFGARAVPQGPGGSLSRAPPPSVHGRAYAPPSSYDPSVPGQYERGSANGVQVSVVPPSDLRQLKLIHKTIEMLITHGPEFECLLMSRPEVQRDEKWAWVWSPRSPGGVWYRWRLWEILTGAKKSRRDRRSGTTHQVFSGSAPWLEPEDDITFEYTTKFSDLISESDYDSSDEDDSGDEGDRKQQRRRRFDGPPPDTAALNADDQTYLNPLQKAKLTHLLARLPTTLGKLRKGDVARVTAFAISHAGQGSDEVVAMLVANVLAPVAWGAANPDRAPDAADDPGASDDVSPAKLIALYLISDILSSSSTSGVRHAWRYRALFEAALTRRRAFEHLGALDKTLGWGRMRADKWRRSVAAVLTLWEGWCVFPQAAQERFAEVFWNPPAEKGEAAAEEAEKKAAAAAAAGGKSRWKAVDAGAAAAAAVESARREEQPAVDEDVDGEPMVEDEDVDGEPMQEDDEDIDGEPMDDDVDGEPMQEDEEPGESAPAGLDGADERPAPPLAGATTPAPVRKPRPRAVDMFADSDDE